MVVRRWMDHSRVQHHVFDFSSRLVGLAQMQIHPVEGTATLAKSSEPSTRLEYVAPNIKIVQESAASQPNDTGKHQTDIYIYIRI